MDQPALNRPTAESLLKYPIRLRIAYLLRSTDLPGRAIAERMQCSIATVSRVNSELKIREYLGRVRDVFRIRFRNARRVLGAQKGRLLSISWCRRDYGSSTFSPFGPGCVLGFLLRS